MTWGPGCRGPERVWGKLDVMGHCPDAPREGFRFEDVCFEVGGRLVLDHVSVVLGCEGITVIVGPSGSGKSTLLRMCNRLEVPTSGRVLLDGIDLATIGPTTLRRRVAMVFQRPVVFGGSVRDNLCVADPNAADARFADVLQRAGLSPDVLDREAATLSGGEAQRLCVARALLTDPEILLMDEPTSALDVDHRLRIEELARGLAMAGIPILWVTHDLEQAARIADERVELVDGRVVGIDEVPR